MYYAHVLSYVFYYFNKIPLYNCFIVISNAFLANLHGYYKSKNIFAT